jgi:hypothetical protein
LKHYSHLLARSGSGGNKLGHAGLSHKRWTERCGLRCGIWVRAWERICAVNKSNAALQRIRRRQLIVRYGTLVSSFLTLWGLIFVSHHLG